MSSNAPVPVPRTAVPLGIADPVVQARTELKAALAAIEDKANLPRRISKETDRRIAQAKEFKRRHPVAAAVVVVGAAAAIGAAVWGFVRLYTR